MPRTHRWAALVPVCVLLALTGCRDLATEEEEGGYEPAVVEPIEGSDLSRVILTEDAARRIHLETSTATERGNRVVVPESAIWVDVAGAEWVYTEPEPLVFQRAHVVVERYRDGRAFLDEGIEAGDEVVSVGVPQLIGSEFGI